MTVSGEDRGILIKMQIEYLGCGGAWMEDMDGHRTLSPMPVPTCALPSLCGLFSLSVLNFSMYC